MQYDNPHHNISISQDELAKLLSDFIVFLKTDDVKFDDEDLEFDVPMAVEHIHKAFKLDGHPFQLVIKVADILEKKYEVACRHGDPEWDE